MQLSRSRFIGLLATVLAGASLSLAVTALGHGGKSGGESGSGGGGGNGLLRASLVPSLPTDDTLHGVAPGGVPWVLDRGSVRLKRDGRLRLRVEGLVIPPPQGTNTAGGVTRITASVFCASSTTAAATSDSAPLSQAGDARIDDDLTLSGACVGPVVLVHPNGNATRYIAASGFGR